jgi:hypothetical protein
VGNLKCACGSERFKSGLVKLSFIGIPCTLDDEDGPQYNDMLADQAFGWDTEEYDEVICRACEREFILHHDEDGKMVLEPAG